MPARLPSTHVHIAPCCIAGGTDASLLLFVPPTDPQVPMGVPNAGNVLASAQVPRGTTISLTSFAIEGQTRMYTPGSGPLTLTDPKTGAVIGSITIAADGKYAFTPVPDYVGPVPAINLYARSSDGKAAITSLTLNVLPRLSECTWAAFDTCKKGVHTFAYLDYVQVSSHNVLPSWCAWLLDHACPRYVFMQGPHRHPLHAPHRRHHLPSA